jgi:catechol 2,3-dioxygenase-like lactoylglutathione lyase family enzyme
MEVDKRRGERRNLKRNGWILVACFLPLAAGQTLPAPHFHHLHLNSTNPDKAIDFYTRQFPSTAKTVVAGLPALKSGPVYLLFNRVKSPPPTGPQSAIWHFGWHVTDVRKNLESYRRSSEVKLLPMYTSPDQSRPDAFISSDTWPGIGGVLGLTKEQIAEAKAKGIQPQGGPGFAYLQGPDGAIIEYQGNFPAERFNHVHMYQEDPYCAGLWYRNHLGAAGDVPRGEGDCKAERSAFSWPALVAEGTRRAPRVNMNFDDVVLTWYPRQDDHPLVPSRGQVTDHIGLSVSDLDAWIAKLRREGVKFLGRPYRLGEWRAVMIEGPSKEALELIEIK